MSHSMEDMKAKMEELKRNKETLMSWVSNEIASGCQQFDLKSCGEAIDMIKDLASAEKDCWESMYYQTVIEAMTEYDEEGPMGYNNRRMSNGQYAPSGKGRVRGYRPMVDQEPYIDAYLHDPNIRRTTDMMDMMGYSNGDRNMPRMDEDMTEMNNNYSGYRDAKEMYRSSGSSSDRMEMEKYQMGCVKEMAKKLGEIWEDADPVLKRKLKDCLKEFLEE